MTTNVTQVFPILNPSRPRKPRVRSLEIRGPAGRMEALLNEGADDAPVAALVCHPHPLGGGTMHNKVVYHAMKVLNDPDWGFGYPVLRFNFRGTGLSEGQHDGQAESEDVRTALDWLENEFKRPLVVVGFSFGAAMALAACCAEAARPASNPASNLAKSDARIQAIAALGLPTHAEGRDYQYPFLRACTLPKLFLSGDRDPFAPAAQLAEVVASCAEPKRLLLLADADHFFTGQLEPMQSAFAGWLKEQVQ